MVKHAKRYPINQLLESLHRHFGTNIKNMNSDTLIIIERIDVYSRTIDAIRTELQNAYSANDRQKMECANILEEIFADFSQAMYLFSVGLIVPARMLVRRALELGVTSVYMWDMPHEYWGWIKHEEDLSFSKMVEHLSSARYATYLVNLGGYSDCDQKKIKDFYRNLSNTIHGKLEGLTPLSPERYKSDKNNIEKDLELTVEVQLALIKLWCGRFPSLDTFINKEFPSPLRGVVK